MKKDEELSYSLWATSMNKMSRTQQKRYREKYTIALQNLKWEGSEDLREQVSPHRGI